MIDQVAKEVMDLLLAEVIYEDVLYDIHAKIIDTGDNYIFYADGIKVKEHTKDRINGLVRGLNISRHIDRLLANLLANFMNAECKEINKNKALCTHKKGDEISFVIVKAEGGTDGDYLLRVWSICDKQGNTLLESLNVLFKDNSQVQMKLEDKFRQAVIDEFERLVEEVKSSPYFDSWGK